MTVTFRHLLPRLPFSSHFGSRAQYSYLGSTPLFIVFSTGMTTLKFKEGGFGLIQSGKSK